MGEITPPYYQDERGVWHITIYGNAPVPVTSGSGYSGTPDGFDIPEILVGGRPIPKLSMGGGGNGNVGFGFGDLTLTPEQKQHLFWLIIIAALGMVLLATNGRPKFA